MSTFLEMQQRIADDLNRTDLTTQIKKAINRAIIYYEKEPFWFKETSATFSTVASQKAYTEANMSITDISRIHLVEAVLNSANYELDEHDIKWIEGKNPNDATGQPTDYAWWQLKLYFYLVPNAIYTIRVWYTKKYTALSADSDTNDWTTYAEDLIEARARKWLYGRVIKDANNATIAGIEEQEALESLRGVSEGHVAQGKIPPTSF